MALYCTAVELEKTNYPSVLLSLCVNVHILVPPVCVFCRDQLKFECWHILFENKITKIQDLTSICAIRVLITTL